MEKPNNLSQPGIRILIAIGVLCTLFVLSVGTSAWLSLMILVVIAFFGLIIGGLICDINHRLNRGRKANL